MEGLKLCGRLVIVSRSRRAQEALQWYLLNRETCQLEAVERNGGFDLFCHGEHNVRIGGILSWSYGSQAVDVVGFSFKSANDPEDKKLFEHLIIVPKSDLGEIFREAVRKCQ